MSDLAKGTTFVDGISIANASNLNNLVDLGTILPNFISDKTDNASPSTGCELVINDGGTLKKVTIANLATVITGGSAGVIHGKTAVTALTNDDEFLLWEDTAADERKITYANLVTALVANLGLDPSHIGFPATMDVLTGTRTYDPPSISSLNAHQFTVTVTGALTANAPSVALGFSIDIFNAPLFYSGRVSAANTVEVTYWNGTGSSINLGSHTIRATVFQF